MSRPAKPDSTVTYPLVVQHNALINSRFELSTVESRLFLSLLSRIGPKDSQFVPCRVPVKELMADSTSQNSYDHIRKTIKDFAARTLVIDEVDSTGRLVQRGDVVIIPLLAYAQYKRGEGVVEARFNDSVMPYLLQLRDNFTKAQLVELLKLKSSSSYRIYWLLREYATFGKRTMAVEELKAVLGMENDYIGRFDNFKMRVLDKAQEELAHTDLPFTYELIRQGRAVTEIKFLFATAQSTAIAASPEHTGWESAVLAVGVGEKSLGTIRNQLQEGMYEEGYVHYVLAAVRAKVVAGKVKKEGGAVFKALTEGYLLPDYRKHLAVWSQRIVG